jgi:hypothetical protein
MERRADRMSCFLFDPLDPPDGAWPRGQEAVRHYIESIARAGVGAMVANLHCDWLALRSGERVLPVTINHGERGGSYVCLPHSAYVLYGRRELALVDLGLLAPLAHAAIGLVDLLLRAVRINRIVHVDNWLLSTNLHGDWAGEDARAVRECLAARYPEHLLAVRSVDPWSSPALEAALREDGWLMLPSRQVWVVDDLRRNWRSRTSVGHDRRILRRSPMTVESPLVARPGDVERIAELYQMLYLDKYSGLNPAFTPAWIEVSHGSGMLAYRVLRDADGRIQAVAGSWLRAGVLTPPIVGYDTARPRGEGLYRIASLLFCEHAEAAGARLHASAGAADFKRVRGARPVIECTAVWTGGIAPWRRWLLRGFAALLWWVAVPLMRRRQL